MQAYCHFLNIQTPSLFYTLSEIREFGFCKPFYRVLTDVCKSDKKAGVLASEFYSTSVIN